jgi:hypothetical protein
MRLKTTLFEAALACSLMTLNDQVVLDSQFVVSNLRLEVPGKDGEEITVFAFDQEIELVDGRGTFLDRTGQRHRIEFRVAIPLNDEHLRVSKERQGG